MYSEETDIIYTVVVPVHHSEGSLKELLHRIIQVFTKQDDVFEVVFVDDYSKDKSWEVLSELKTQFPEVVRLIRLAKNYGQHSATLCGFRYGRGDFVITLDDDLQHRPEDIPSLIKKMKETEADIVYGTSQNQQVAYRRWGSFLWKFGTRNFNNALGQGSSFRIIKSSIVKQLIHHQQHFVFIDEMMYWYTDNVVTQEVQFKERAKGKSGYSTAKVIKLAYNLTLYYTTIPLKIMTLGGLMLSFFTFLLGVFFVVKKVVYGVPVPGFTALIVTVLFSTSTVLICFGIIGRYLGKIITILNKKPTYSIVEKRL